MSTLNDANVIQQLKDFKKIKSVLILKKKDTIYLIAFISNNYTELSKLINV
jgi:hypothetical protein